MRDDKYDKMKKGIKNWVVILVSLAVIFGITILITFLISWNKAIIWLSIVLILVILAILVLSLLALDYEVAKDAENAEDKVVEKKFDLTLVGILTKLLLSLILVVGIFFTIEMAYEHFINQEHTAFFQRIVIFFTEGNTNYINGGSDLSDHIGYLQLLVAVVTIAIGGIALINYVTGKEALREVREESKNLDRKVEGLKTEIRQSSSKDLKEKDGAELKNLKKILSEEDLNDT